MAIYVDQIVRTSKMPFYHQLYEILRAKIVRGDWQPGQMIPAESEIVRIYKVSRITARQALDGLVQDGLIYRERGRGTFVAQPTFEKAMMRIRSFTDDMQQRGLKARTKVLCKELIPAPAEIASQLGIPEQEELVRFQRLRMAGDDPLSIEESFLIHRTCPGILSHDFAQESLREVLTREYGIRWSRATQHIRSILAPPPTAALLGIKPKSALLYVERVSYDEQNTPGEFLRIMYRGDRYVLYNELSG
jgi:GntR family transcriptional regulator